MLDLEKHFCINPKCKYFGLKNQDNISTRGSFGKENDRVILYCRSCNKRFAASHASAYYRIHISPEKIREIIYHTTEGLSIRRISKILQINKDTVNRVILFSEEHCLHVIGDLLQSLNLKEDQFEMLMKFFDKRKISQKIVNSSSTQYNKETL